VSKIKFQNQLPLSAVNNLKNAYFSTAQILWPGNNTGLYQKSGDLFEKMDIFFKNGCPTKKYKFIFLKMYIFNCRL